MYIAMYKDGQYYKAKVVDGHLENQIDFDSNALEIYNERIEFLYGVKLTEELLQGFAIPNLGYKKTNNGFQIFDVTMEEYIEEPLPVYVDVFGSITKTKKWISFKTPTTDSINAAREIYKNLEKKLDKLSEQKAIAHIVKLVEEGNGIAYIDIINPFQYDIFAGLSKNDIKVLFSNRGRYVVGKNAKKPVLDLYVPKYLVPMVIGKGGEVIKKITSEVNAKRINVKEIEA